jgi:C4-dicarboxylate-specific signal transduction histidine kinase
MSALSVRSQKMEALGTMAGGIAHDFNSMLAVSGSRGLADRILVFSRTGLTHRTPVEIQRAVAEALELLKVSLPPHVRLQQALSASNARVIGDPMQLHRVIFFQLAFSCRNDRREVQL